MDLSSPPKIKQILLGHLVSDFNREQWLMKEQVVLIFHKMIWNGITRGQKNRLCASSKSWMLLSQNSSQNSLKYIALS